MARSGMSAISPRKRFRYHLKTPYRDGTTDVIFEPLDFIAKLAALAERVRSHAQI